jgi:1-acyl-sn-glycerol-3-phosphate acyltransferase
MLYVIGRLLAKIAFRILCGFKVYGTEHLPLAGGFVLASNHLSFLDPVVLGAASPRKLYFMARHELFKFKPFGWLLKGVHAFPIRREGRDTRAIKEAIRKLSAGEVVTLFPEGTRSASGFLGKGHSGVGMLAVKANVPIVPVYIYGTDQVLPRDAKFITPSKIMVRFGEPIILGSLALKEAAVGKKELYNRITDAVMDEISRLRIFPEAHSP